MADLQSRLGVKQPRISLWITAMRENLAEIPDLVRLAADIQVPEVYVQRLVYFLDGGGQECGLMEAGQAVFGAYDAAEDAILARAEALAAELGVSLRASGATDPRSSMMEADGRERPWSACIRPWTTAYITANGNALPCCVSPFATTDYQSLILGNVLERPFAEIWNDAPYQSWRDALLSDRPPLVCSGCGVCWSL
jgi:MoaA/NifB/PqqE/SkfB family radical SAM enzyme